MALLRKHPVRGRRTILQAALYHARKHRVAKLSVKDTGPVYVPIWNSIFSKGNRLATGINSNGNGLITAVAAVSMTNEVAPFNTAFNSNEGDGPYYSGGALTAGVSAFTWTFSEAVAISGLAFTGGDTTDLGMWNLDGSNDGSAWTTLSGSPFHWSQTATGWLDNASKGSNFTFANTKAYTHYRLCYQSGTFNGGRLCNELFFKVMSHPVLANSKSFVLTAGGTSMAVFNRPIGELSDGLYHIDYPTNAPDQVRFVTPTAGDWLAFDFGLNNSVSVKRFVLDADGQFGDCGLWKWQVSTDGAAWKDSGSSFEWNGLSQPNDLIYGGGAQADKGRYWRLKCVTPGANMNGMYEIVFDFYDE